MNIGTQKCNPDGVAYVRWLVDGAVRLWTSATNQLANATSLESFFLVQYRPSRVSKYSHTCMHMYRPITVPPVLADTIQVHAGSMTLSLIARFGLHRKGKDSIVRKVKSKNS